MKKIQVSFLGPIGLAPKEFEASNLQDLKLQLQAIESLREWLPLSAIAINDKMVESLDYEFENGDHVVLLPPVCGG